MDEEGEAQRGEGSCPRPHSKSVAKLGFACGGLTPQAVPLPSGHTPTSQQVNMLLLSPLCSGQPHSISQMRLQGTTLPARQQGAAGVRKRPFRCSAFPGVLGPPLPGALPGAVPGFVSPQCPASSPLAPISSSSHCEGPAALWVTPWATDLGLHDRKL